MAEVSKWIPLFIIFAVCLVIIVMRVKSINTTIDQDDIERDIVDDTSEVEYHNDHYDVYDEVKSFMAKQADYVMNG